MPPFRDLTGQQFGRLKAIRLAGRTAAGQAMWECLCQCGKTTTVYGVSLTRGKSQSCDCLRLERVKAAATKHGHAQRSFHQTGTYTSWCSMLARCQNPNRERYPNWGGRGITVCERWQGEHGFENFLADMGPRPAGTTLDRFPNNDGNYEPGNCRWATPKEQQANTHPKRTRI